MEMSPYIYLDVEAQLLPAMLRALHAHGRDLGIKVADHRGTELLKWPVRYATTVSHCGYIAAKSV